MKKGIEIWTDYDNTNRWRLHLKKQKGKFTMDEIRQALREYGEDFYLIAVNCYSDLEPQFDEDDSGGYITAYTSDVLAQEAGL